MTRIFGFDIGTTSIGWAVIDYDKDREVGEIVRKDGVPGMGVRIFPEARDEKGTPLNQQRRQKRMMRRQLRRRKDRRRLLNELLSQASLLPKFTSAPRERGHSKSEWEKVMALDAYALRARGLFEKLDPHEFGRALYHLSKRRHFKGRDLEDNDAAEMKSESKEAKEDSKKEASAKIADSANAEELEATKAREATLDALKAEGKTLGQWLAAKKSDATKGKPPSERRRGVHAHRTIVEEEFERLWEIQAKHHPSLAQGDLKARIQDAIFSQRPVFWRKNTLGECRFMPGEALCPKGAWLSQQKRMLEKLNNLAIVGGNARPLDDEERTAILAKLQMQASMTWGGVRSALKPLFKQRGEPGAEKTLKFNLEVGGDGKLSGNFLEAKLADIFGDLWPDHRHKRAIRDAIHERLWKADYGEIGGQRVVILSSAERAIRRADAAQSFIEDFDATEEQAAAIKALKLPTGWEPFSIVALKAFLPHLENGVRFGELVSGPEWEEWRNTSFPTRERPTGEIRDNLPSPNRKTNEGREEQQRIAKLRNPTVVRTQNELRKVVNNLIRLYGKPDKIRVEVARDVGRSKREREEIKSVIRRNERQREAARKDLQSKGIAEPSRDYTEKWLLWKESQEKCPYTGDSISFDALFREGRYQVEHIWPRWRSFDDSFGNKTLCRTDVNIEKADKTPFEAFGPDTERWAAIQTRLDGLMVRKGAPGGLPPGKVRRFLAESIPEGFATRQLNDTRYASKLILAQLKKLWPDLGPEAPVNVQAVTGSVTAQLRRMWGLNNILSDDGEKTRADHRHHAVDALVVACAHPGMTQRLSNYWQAKDDPRVAAPRLNPPWPTIRTDAERIVAEIIVSHRVQKKVSGPLHKETIYGDTGDDIKTKSGVYRQFVTRKRVDALTKGEIEEIRDEYVRRIVRDWVVSRGGDPKKAFPPYPRLGEAGPEIKRVRLLTKQQLSLMAPTSTGYADLGANHHIAIYTLPSGKAVYEVVSLHEASRRLARRESIIRRDRQDGAKFIFALATGEVVEIKDGEEKGIWVVKGVEADGRAALARHNDARPSTTNEASRLGMDAALQKFRPRLGGLLRRGAQKVSIDPIGYVRPARD